MNAFLREAKDYRFELRDTSLIISKTGYYGEKERDHLVENHENFILFKVAGSVFAIEIFNFINTMKSPAAAAVVQQVLSTFSYMFKPQETHREQLVDGLKYFVLAEYYKVLSAAFPEEMLRGIKRRYEEFLETIETLNKEHEVLEERARVNHIEDPLVASNGLLVYATLNYNWFIWETKVKNSEHPEYVWSVDKRSHLSDEKPSKLKSNIFKGRQNECQAFVIGQQKDAYGISYSELLQSAANIQFIEKSIADFEILLNTPKDETRQAKLEGIESQAHLEQSAVANEELLKKIVEQQKQVVG